mgnify:CR=1 FL=1
MTWVNPKETEIIIKNCVNSIIDDLDLYDYESKEVLKERLEYSIGGQEQGFNNT